MTTGYEYPDDFSELTPSTQLLYVLIRDHGPVSQPELRDLTALSEWTVWNSTKELESRGIVDRSPSEKSPGTIVCDIHER